MVHAPRHFFTSIIQYKRDRNSSASPPLNNTNELVHRFLLMGNHRCQIPPPTTPKIPNSTIHVTILRLLFCFLSQWPVSTPIKVVPIAGIVWISPSGSRLPSYKCPVKSFLSSHAGRFCT